MSQVGHQGHMGLQPIVYPKKPVSPQALAENGAPPLPHSHVHLWHHSICVAFASIIS